MISETLITLPETIEKDQIIEVKTLVSHARIHAPMNIKATFNDTEFFQAELSEHISANPYLSFFLKISEKGLLKITWSDKTGRSVTQEKQINIS